jgi:hypothetical protein
MLEVFRHWDTATVGLVNSLLEEAGVQTVLRNWEGSNIVEVPIPVIYPNICVLNGEDYARAKEMIEAYMNGPTAEGQEWVCTKCGESIGQQLSECWNCGKERVMHKD